MTEKGLKIFFSLGLPVLCKTGNRVNLMNIVLSYWYLYEIWSIEFNYFFFSHITPCPSLNLGLIGEQIFQEKISSTRVENTLQIVYLESFVINARNRF